MSETINPVSPLSPSEMYFCRYLMKHRKQVKHMSIRELSRASYVSTASIMRLIRKIGYPGYTEFQTSLCRDGTGTQNPLLDERGLSVSTFFDLTCSDTEFLYSLRRAAGIISASRRILFTGDSYGHCACESGIRLFEQTGRTCGCLEHNPGSPENDDTAVVVILGAAAEPEAQEIVSSLPAEKMPVIMIYCGGYRPFLPCLEISCVYENEEPAQAYSLIPAIHTLELLQKQVIHLS